MPHSSRLYCHEWGTQFCGWATRQKREGWGTRDFEVGEGWGTRKMEDYIHNALIFLLGLFAGYLPAYVNKKAENRAMKEDVATLTRLAEEIKTSLADKSWDRQRHWEMKRDAVICMIQSLGLADDALRNLAHFFRTNGGRNAEARVLDETLKMSRDYREKVSKFNQLRFEASLLGGKELDQAMKEANLSMLKIAREALGENPYDSMGA